MGDVRAEYALPPLPPEGRDDRRVLFLAIARGIVDYLGDHEEALVVTRHGGGSGRHDGNDDGHVRVVTQP